MNTEDEEGVVYLTKDTDLVALFSGENNVFNIIPPPPKEPPKDE